MKKPLLLLLTNLIFLYALGQELVIKQLELQIKAHPQADTFRVNRLNELGLITSLDPGRLYTSATEALAVSKKIKYPVGEGFATLNLGNYIFQKGDKSKALGFLQDATNIAQKTGDKALLINVYLTTGELKSQSVENKQALFYFFKAESEAENQPDKKLLSLTQSALAQRYENSFSDYPKAMEWVIKAVKSADEANCTSCLADDWADLATIYTDMGQNDQSLEYYKKALAANKKLNNKALERTLTNSIGEYYRLQGNYAEALKNYQASLALSNTPMFIEIEESNIADAYLDLNDLQQTYVYGLKSLAVAKEIKDTEGIAWIDAIISRAFFKQGKADSAIYYAKNGFNTAKEAGTLEYMRDNTGILSDAFAHKGDFKSAYQYKNLFISYRDSMNNRQILNKTNLLLYNYNLAKKQGQIAALSQDKKIQRYFLAGAFIIMLLIAVTLVVSYRNNRQKEKANLLLNSQKLEIEQQRDQTNKALANLQLTQTQLIQSEKMSSLGELTAGIAHEIQNPLNFINNFSDVNRELIEEMQQELILGNTAEVLSIAADISQNEEKINHHGKRADGIVKGMLQHSRASSTVKEPANINTLADEYLRLAYHGLRAKDKSFSADLIAKFDSALPAVNVVPQDIGRVLLNLFNNAFYAVQQRQKEDSTFNPVIKLNTSLLKTPFGKNYVIITVEDNGVGIPDDIKDKILQPFFTTKPTGEGTGLGLSLSYDIVVKAHDGEIDLVSKPGEYTEFKISLPV